MNLLDYYYRGFKEYRAETENNKSCLRDRKLFSRNGLKFDSFKVTKYLCTIESDWIEELEKGLEFVEKAVAEERQFIRVNGEVVPIEKAKKVSKYSVEHLARHSNMITHVPDDPDEPIIPDSIYMVEKLSDYAVYENRFLYMLLCYIRDFISLRLEKIQRLRMTYICDFSLAKEQDAKLRKLNFKTEFHEERYDNPYPIQDDLSQSLLQRIEDCQQIVVMLLNTNLMTEVSKAPMLKPPIIKTNVLKMNNNFKNSLALYDYIVSYSKDGYSAEAVVKEFMPFSNLLADELAELGALTAFLTYKNGNEIEEILNNEYQIEEARRKEEEAKKLVEQIKRLKKRVAESGMGMEEYILLVEKRNRMLEDDARELIIARNTIKELNDTIEELKQQIDELNRRIEDLNLEIQKKLEEIAYLNQKYIEDMAALRKQHAIEIENLNLLHKEELERLTNDYEARIEEINIMHQQDLDDLASKHLEEINNLNEEHNEEINDLNRQHQNELLDLEDRLTIQYTNEINEHLAKLNELDAELKAKNEQYDQLAEGYSSTKSDLLNQLDNARSERERAIADYENKLKNICKDYDEQLNVKQLSNDYDKAEFAKEVAKLKDNISLLQARLNTLRIEKGEMTPSENLTKREEFEELENQFLVFNEFFKSQWELTKKAIRKEIFWSKQEKKRKRKLKGVKAPNEKTNAILDDNQVNQAIENNELSNNDSTNLSEPTDDNLNNNDIDNSISDINVDSDGNVINNQLDNLENSDVDDLLNDLDDNSNDNDENDILAGLDNTLEDEDPSDLLNELDDISDDDDIDK